MTIQEFKKMCVRYADAESELRNAKYAIQRALELFGQPSVVKIDWIRIGNIGRGVLKPDIEAYMIQDAVDRRVIPS